MPTQNEELRKGSNNYNDYDEEEEKEQKTLDDF